MTPLSWFKLFLWYFGHFKVPLIGHLKPKLIHIDEKEIIVKLPLGHRTRNHLHSMYFGALAVGADLAGGMHGFYHAKQSKVKASIVFKSFQANFIRRPETDVYFICKQGEVVKEMLREAQKTKERINKFIEIRAFVNYPVAPEEVANFNLELSIRV
jgi:acyl-coenzyme A thioesterase PaaI-like protein